MEMKNKNMGYYHNGTNTVDDPQIKLLAESLGGFCSGPFKTFTEAKKDLIIHYKSMMQAYKIALIEANELLEEFK